jgi:hypothetical protein
MDTPRDKGPQKPIDTQKSANKWGGTPQDDRHEFQTQTPTFQEANFTAAQSTNNVPAIRYKVVMQERDQDKGIIIPSGHLKTNGRGKS